MSRSQRNKHKSSSILTVDEKEVGDNEAIAKAIADSNEAKPSKSQRRNAKRKDCSIKIPKDLFLVGLGTTASGSKDGKIKHWIDGSEGSLIVAFDGEATELGLEWLNSIQEEYNQGGIKAWKETYHADGNEILLEKVMQDIFLRQIDPSQMMGKPFDFKKDLFEPLVQLQLNKADVLMPLYFENGSSCSSGGYSDRTEILLSNHIPFFHSYFGTMHRLFHIKAVFIRASEEGTHDKHSDNFTRGATHRFILSINSNGKKMFFGTEED